MSRTISPQKENGQLKNSHLKNSHFVWNGPLNIGAKRSSFYEDSKWPNRPWWCLRICNGIFPTWGDLTPSGVDMQPEMMFFANVGDRIDGIECSEDGRSGRSRHHERNLSIADALVNQSLQFFWNHLSFFIARNADAIVCSQSGSSSCAHHGKVALHTHKITNEFVMIELI